MNAETDKKQEVRITDIRMPFGSMVIFMVKWAVASIPALILLTLLGTVLSGIIIGLLSSIRPTSGQQLSSKSIAIEEATPPSASIVPPPSSTAVAHRHPVPALIDLAKRAAEESAYVSKIQVRNVRRCDAGADCALVEIENDGDHSLKRAELTIYCLDSDGKALFQKNFVADKPIDPGETEEFSVYMVDLSPYWARYKLDVKALRVTFQ
jgi:hypothetical protein